MDPMAMFLGVIAIIGVPVVAIAMLRYLNGPPKEVTKLGMAAIDLADKLNHILTIHDLWAEDRTYTFPNGDVWHKDG